MATAQTAGSPVIPALRYRDAHAAIAWLQRAFGFRAKQVFAGPDNSVAHAELTLGSGMIMLGSASNPGPQTQMFANPAEIGGRVTQSIYLLVPDAAATYDSAQAAGAEITMPLAEMSYGGKAFGCRDLEGYLWSIGSYDPWTNAGG
jgi:uncharacterized glyoxalase superfamily protein PhnB